MKSPDTPGRFNLHRIEEHLKNNKVQARDALAATGSTLTDIHGLGVVLATKILGHVGDITRFPNADHFPSYTGTAPLDASRGEQIRHRLNTGGNRQLNSVLHTIAVCQTRDPLLDICTSSANSPRTRPKTEPAATSHTPSTDASTSSSNRSKRSKLTEPWVRRSLDLEF